MPEILRGTGERIGLSTVLQVAEMECLTGRVSVSLGELGFHVGAPVRARRGPLSGVDALLELLLHPVGGFVVEAADEPLAPPLGDLGALILEGCRLQDEWRRVEARVLLPTDTHALAAPLDALRPLLDGRRRVAEAVALARVPRCRVTDPLIQAVEAGHLVERPAPAEPALAGAPVDFHETIEEGRRCVREGRLDAARTAFERALRQRPDDRIALQNLRRLAALQGA